LDYLWPTNSGNYLSSTFGETRSAHFHAGLDIKTWGREGYKVYASKEGILYRLLVTERGYGNAVYLKHPDGTFTVYAHMQRFNDAFQAMADSIRMIDYSFEMDVIMDSLQIKVEQGDVIGYTGSTGIGPPHLHFEIRDSIEQPINALTSNLTVKDELPPVFSSIILEPLSKDSRIEGRPTSYYSRVKETRSGVYDFGEVNVSGKTGFAVNVYDRANDVYNAYAVYSLALIQDSDTLFYEELNTFSYNEPSEMTLDRIAPFGSSQRGHQRLYKKDGSNNPFYIITKEQAMLIPEDSARNYTIVASDYFGNTSTAKITLVKSSRTSSSSLGELNTNPEKWFWSENWFSPDLKSTIDLRRDDLGYPWSENQQIVQLDSSTSVNFTRIKPTEPEIISTPDQRLKVRFGTHAFFDTLTVATGYDITNNEIQISIQPQMLAIKSDYQVQLYMGDAFEPGNKYRLFQKDNSDESLDYIDSELIGRTIHAYPSELGEFVIMPDSTAPEISYFQVYQTDYGVWKASVQVTDEETGIESSSAVFKVNGVRGIAEYDYEKDLLIYSLPGFDPNSSNTAYIEIKDKAGNTAQAIFEN
tara:strand:- start:9923 stop:11677 length:1755 start_codon:yes stop_codon:yes gene_type:complete